MALQRQSATVGPLRRERCRPEYIPALGVVTSIAAALIAQESALVSRPHAAQIRLLSVLALAPEAEFVDLAQLGQARQVRPGDELFMPTLVARGWAEMGPRFRGGVRITDAGRFILVHGGNVGETGIRPRERKA